MPQANAHIGANQVIGFNSSDGRPKGGRCKAWTGCDLAAHRMSLGRLATSVNQD